MTLCKTTGLACCCQPDEGVPCPHETIEQVVAWGHEWRTAALNAQAEVARAVAAERAERTRLLALQQVAHVKEVREQCEREVAAENERLAQLCDDMALYTGVDCAAAIRSSAPRANGGEG